MGVEGRERFVEKQDFGLGDERTGERHALALAAGELRDVARGELGDLQAFEPFHGLGGAGSSIETAHLEPEFDILQNVEEREQGKRLPDHGRVAVRRLDLVHAAARQADLAAGRLFEARQHAQGGGLAAAGRSHDRQELALGDFQVHVLDRDEVAEVLDHAVEDDQGFAHGVRSFVPRVIRRTWAMTTSVMEVRKTNVPMALICGST